MPRSKLTVGNVEIIALDDNEASLPLSDLFPSVPAEAWAPYQQRYPESFDGTDNAHTHFDCYLVRSEGRTVLVDTGIGGSATNPGTVDAFVAGVDGRLMAELEAAGVRAEDVNTIFMTHLHPDHVGWNLTHGDGGAKLTFPNARYVAHQADWDAFNNPDIRGQFPFSFWDETVAPLANMGVLDLLSGEKALTGELTAIPTPGHTPGHMSLAIVSGGQHAIIMGDVAGNPAQITELEWCHIFEMDPAQTAQTRRQLFDRLEEQDSILVTCHYPPPGYGKLVRVEGRRYWQAL